MSWKFWGYTLSISRGVILLVRMWVENQRLRLYLYLFPVILLVRMWVEKCDKILQTIWRWVILLVRMWVEKCVNLSMIYSSTSSSSLWGCELKNWLNLYNVRYLLSSSLWGCELKRWWTKFESITWRHPPCEDVSWKVIHHLLCSLYDRHPSCEDVSWKNYIVYLQTKGFVILHVRMWVEKFYHVTL